MLLIKITIKYQTAIRMNHRASVVYIESPLKHLKITAYSCYQYRVPCFCVNNIIRYIFFRIFGTNLLLYKELQQPRKEESTYPYTKTDLSCLRGPGLWRCACLSRRARAYATLPNPCLLSLFIRVSIFDCVTHWHRSASLCAATDPAQD